MLGGAQLNSSTKGLAGAIVVVLITGIVALAVRGPTSTVAVPSTPSASASSPSTPPSSLPSSVPSDTPSDTPSVQPSPSDSPAGFPNGNEGPPGTIVQTGIDVSPWWVLYLALALVVAAFARGKRTGHPRAR